MSGPAAAEAAAPRPRSAALPGWLTGVPAWFAPASLVASLAAALVLLDHRAGLALTLVAWAVMATVAAAIPARDAWSPVWWAGAAALAAMATVRAADWVVALSLIGATLLAALAAAGFGTWRELAVAPLRWTAGLVPGPLLVLGLASQGLQGRWARVVPALRGIALAAVLVWAFGALFAAADAAFGELVDRTAASLPGLDRPIERLLVGALVAALAGALVWAALAPRAPARAVAPGRLGRAEWTIALGALNLLFAVFVLVQLRTLFGGHDHVLRTAGLTYAEYARQGFGELVTVAALTLAVIAAASRWAAREGRRDDLLLRALLGLLCALTLVVLVSAHRRLGLYVEAFGQSRLRLLAGLEIAWLGGVFGLLLAAGAVRRERWLPRGVVAFSALLWLGFAVSNPDGRIAERNVQRWRETGRIDRAYLSDLSADAAGTLAPLRLAGCPAGGDGLAGFNVGRARARGLCGARRRDG